LRGQWDVASAALPHYRGIILIDADRRVTLDSPDDNGRPARFYGFARVDSGRAHITITDRDTVTHIHCTLQVADVMHCRSFLANGQVSHLFVLTRVGPGPQNLTRPLP
jgi:hypothetical protein